MSQPWQPQYNPGNQPPPVPQPPPGPPQGFGAPPPAPGQFPAQPGYGAYPAPYGQQPPGPGQQPRRGNPVGAFFLGFLVSVIIALIYSVSFFLTITHQSSTVAVTLYLLHALLNGAAVGAVVGMVGHRSTGAQISGAVIAMLGTFFGFTNGVVFMYLGTGGLNFFSNTMREDPFFPAKAWWGDQDGTIDLVSLLGLVVAAAAAWGLAYVVGKRRG